MRLLAQIVTKFIQASLTGSLSKDSANTNPPLHGSAKSDIKEQGHQIDWENIKVLEREPKEFSRRILEAIHIRTLKTKTEL